MSLPLRAAARLASGGIPVSGCPTSLPLLSQLEGASSSTELRKDVVRHDAHP